MTDLRERVRKFHEIEGVSYKTIAQIIDVSLSVMYNFTSGVRELKDHKKELLNEYLESKGY